MGPSNNPEGLFPVFSARLRRIIGPIGRRRQEK